MSSRIIDPRIKIMHIACFLEVAKLRSVGNAAQGHNITHRAAKISIKELEEMICGTLFDRSRRGLILTPLGVIFDRYAFTRVGPWRQGMDVEGGGEEAVRNKVG